MATILWFRRDLRLTDNTALTAALKRGAVVPLFVLDPRLVKGRSPRREAWLYANLHALTNDLGRAGARFDPQGRYVRRWLPELADVPSPDIHAPGRASRVSNYPTPIVAHDEARARALDVLTGPTRGSGASAPSDAAADRPDRRGRPR